jgi:hypothetical protein
MDHRFIEETSLDTIEDAVLSVQFTRWPRRSCPAARAPAARDRQQNGVESMRRQRLRLCVPPMLAGLFDLSLTLLGQSASYWAGELWTAREGAPHGMWLFNQHQLAFPLAFAGWIAVYCTAILLLPRGLARVGAVAVTVGHVGAGNSWLSYLAGYWFTIAADIAAAAMIVTALGKEESGWRNRTGTDASLAGRGAS